MSSWHCAADLGQVCPIGMRLTTQGPTAEILRGVSVSFTHGLKDLDMCLFSFYGAKKMTLKTASRLSLSSFYLMLMFKMSI